MFGKSSVTEAATATELLVGLDLGTSKVSVIVAEKEAGYEEPQIIAVDYAQSGGISKGNVVNAELASHSVKKAVNEAETLVGQKIKKVTVAFSCGADVSCVTTCGKFMLGVNSRPVTEEDIKRVTELAQADLAVPSDKTVIHTIPVAYSLDDNDIEDPLTLTGKLLTVKLMSVLVPTHTVQNVVNCVRRAGLEIEGLILKPLASALSVATREEAQTGAVILDIGGGTAGVAVMSNGQPIYLDTVPVGGDHITNDLAIVLKVPLLNAEEIKRKVQLFEEMGAETQTEGTPERFIEFICNNRLYKVSRTQVLEIINCRIEELCSELIIPKIKASGIRSVGGGIIITGGVSKMPGIDMLMRDIFSLPVRIAVPEQTASMPQGKNTQEFASAAGIIRYIAEKRKNPHRYSDNLPEYAKPKQEENRHTSKIDIINSQTKENAKNLLSSSKDKFIGLFKDLF